MQEVSIRRARRSGSLAAAVGGLLDDLQCPIPTQAVRIMLTARGRPVSAEQLSRLAAYQREDFQRTRFPPPLCWALDPDGSPALPRWWARGDWRLMRRVRTPDGTPIWCASLAVRLCAELADSAQPNSDLVTLTLGLASLALDTSRIFDLPMSPEGWLRLRQEIYAPHMGALNNRTGATREQYDAEAALTASDMSGFDLMFGRASAVPA